VQAPAIPRALQAKVEQVASLIDQAQAPLVLVGNGVIRQQASGAVTAFVEKLNLPTATTFMAKGAVPFSHPLCVGTVGLQAADPAAFGLEDADLVVCVGYDMVEYDPAHWNPQGNKRIVHIDSAPAEVDAHYVLAAGIVGDIADALERIGDVASAKPGGKAERLHANLVQLARHCRPAPRHGS
jgi:acetolactate synthase-1/2/3 large subunit